MKTVNIHFFSPTENAQPKTKSEQAAKPAKVVLTGYISSGGKLVLPTKTVTNLGLDLATTLFKVGMDQGKRKAKSLYLVPASDDQGTFSFEKGAKSYSLSLPLILTRSGVDHATTKYAFTIRRFEYEGRTAFELQLAAEAADKAPYEGKPRGRKLRQDSAVAE